MKTIIIEVRGGVVQELYSDAEDLQAILIDWDTEGDPDNRWYGGPFDIQPLDKLPRETISAAFAEAGKSE